MTDVRLVDTTLRDGNQSLWGAVGVTTRTVERVGAPIGRVGCHAIEAPTSTMFATAVRFHQEDPWHRLDVLRRAAPHTSFGFLTTGKRFIGFTRTPRNLMQLAYELLRRHGVTRLWVIDPMNDTDAAIETARAARAAGFEEVVGGICCTISPVHTDEHFAERVARFDAPGAIDSVYLKDQAGRLTPERLRTLVPALRRRLNRLALDELHTHCNTGIAPLTLLARADLGMTRLHCALPLLADGASHASAPQLIANLRARGHRVEIDEAAMAAASAELKREAALRRLPSGAPAACDEAYYRHTVPGGVMGTTRRQLAEMGREHLLPAVIDKTIQVRADLGWPIVVTPFAQYIMTQAALNVIAGERWRQISDEVVDMVLGEWGPMPGPIDGALLDRLPSHPRARRRAQAPPEPEAPALAQLRTRLGPDLSDEDLLLRALMPADQVDAMVRRRAASADPARRGLNALARVLDHPQRPLTVRVRQDGAEFTLTGRRRTAGGSS